MIGNLFQFSSVQSLSHVQLFMTPWIAARQASLSITNCQSSPKLMFIKSVMPSNHLILCRPLLLLLPIPPSIRVFSNESTLHMRWPKYWSFSFSISPSSEHPGLISLKWTGWISLQSKGLSSLLVLISQNQPMDSIRRYHFNYRIEHRSYEPWQYVHWDLMLMVWEVKTGKEIWWKYENPAVFTLNGIEGR